MHHTTATYAPPTFATGPLAGGETGRVGTAVRCLVALAGVMVFGTVGFLVIEPDWDLWQSLYFTLITITTVGYGDDGLSPTGEKFASLLLLAGIGTATYSVSVLVQLAVGCQLAWRRNMQQHIDRLSDHIVVCGFGRIGKTICEQLSAAGVPFVVLEHDESAYQFALELGYPAAHGDATEDDMLRKVGVGRCRGVVCVTDSDAENTFITLSVRDLNGDAFLDIFLVLERQPARGSYILALVNNGDGTFRDETDARLDPIGRRVCIYRLESYDLDRDGDWDLLARPWDAAEPDPIVFLNDGSGHFTRQSFDFELPYLYYDFLDFEGDGGLDLVFVSFAPPALAHAIRQED